MPSNVVDTEKDEEKWEKAKQKAEEAGHGGEYDYIMGIYKDMDPEGIDNESEDNGEKEGSVGDLAQQIVKKANQYDDTEKTASQEKTSARQRANTLRKLAREIRQNGIEKTAKNNQTTVRELKGYIDAIRQ